MGITVRGLVKSYGTATVINAIVRMESPRTGFLSMRGLLLAEMAGRCAGRARRLSFSRSDEAESTRKPRWGWLLAPDRLIENPDPLGQTAAIEPLGVEAVLGPEVVNRQDV